MTAPIRRAAPSDAASLSALGAATFTETFGDLYRAQDLASFLAKSHSREAYDALLSDERCALWLAETDPGEAIGYAVAGPCTLPVPDMPARSGELSRLYLRARGQGGGLGSKMLKQALDWLNANFDHVFLSVYAENFGAQRLYQRFGFRKIHDYFYMVGEHADPEWIMEQRGA